MRVLMDAEMYKVYPARPARIAIIEIRYAAGGQG